MAGTNLEPSPGPDELEVSLFGPGCGEAIAVHLGRERWMLVDSCLDVERRPAALTYLDSIGVSPEQVDLVVASHWHDDHIGGLAEVVRVCENAKFAYSGALRTEEFFALVGALSERSQIRRSGVSEFAEIVRVLEERQSVPRLALEGRRLWSRVESDPVGFISALSPSDTSIALAQRALADLLPTPATSKRAVLAPTPNHASVVLWVAIGQVRILLGADLEETGNPGTGWTAVLDSRETYEDRASVFKVSHHGSANGDQPRVWEELLDDGPWSALTPFVRGSNLLPRESDRQRLLERTGNAFITALPERRVRDRPAAVQATLEEFDAQPVIVDPQMGHIRLRRDCEGDGDWRVDLLGPATHLANVRM